MAAAYDGYAKTYDSLDGGPLATALGLPALRVRAAAAATGDILEIAPGTGLGLAAYWASRGVDPPAAGSRPRPSLPAGVASLALADISPGMLAQATERAAALGLAVTAVVADVAALPFPDASFDTVVDAFSLCVFVDPGAALASVARVLRRGGTAVLLEHARSPFPPLAAYQDATASFIASPVGGGKGCAWNQDVRGLVEGAGLRVKAEERALGGTMTLILAVKSG